MLARIAKTVTSMAATLLAIATGTFLLMEFAPGGAASGDRRLEPAVEAANLARLGLADLVRSPCSGPIASIENPGTVLPNDGIVAVVGGPAGCSGRVDFGGEVLVVLAEPGRDVAQGQVLAAIRPPLYLRYLRMLGSIAAFDLGVTYTSGGERTVRENLVQTLPVSAAVGCLALVMALLLGVPAGLVSAARKGSWPDHAISAVGIAFVSAPAIVLGPFLLYLLAVEIPIFQPGGLESPSDLVLPSATLGLVLAGVFQRMVRAGTLGFVHGPTAMYLRARGVAESRIVGVHGARHAAVAVLGFLPPAMAGLLTGSLVVEQVFNLPGVSRFLVGAALDRDLPMVLGVVLVYSTALVFLNFLAEIAYPLLDPRIRGRGPRAAGDA